MGPVPFPGECGVDGTELEEAAAAGHLGHVIRLRGRDSGSFPLLSLGVEWARRGGEGRGAFTVQDTHGRCAEVTRLLLGPGSRGS